MWFARVYTKNCKIGLYITNPKKFRWNCIEYSVPGKIENFRRNLLEISAFIQLRSKILTLDRKCAGYNVHEKKNISNALSVRAHEKNLPQHHVLGMERKSKCTTRAHTKKHFQRYLRRFYEKNAFIASYSKNVRVSSKITWISRKNEKIRIFHEITLIETRMEFPTLKCPNSIDIWYANTFTLMAQKHSM